ncbi:MAG: DUF1801 domain-containing protein [Rhizobacter sp.]|nr:DUF1801 domain-containing protein [Chlorobiales bacterium]
MAELKTKENAASVDKFISSVDDAERRKACYQVMEMMAEATKSEPRMWGESIVGFGNVRLKYESGRELDWFLTGFSPRKQNITLYISGDFEGQENVMEKLGKYKTGKGCLYIKTLADVKLPVLKSLIKKSVSSPKSSKPQS